MPRIPWKRLNKAQKKKELYANAEHQARVRGNLKVIITYPTKRFRYWPWEKGLDGKEGFNPFETMEFEELYYLVKRDDFLAEL